MRTLLLTFFVLFSSVSNGQETIGYYEGFPYTSIVLCSCKETMLIGTTLYIVVPKEQTTMIDRLSQYSKDRTRVTIENTITHQVNHLLWSLQNKILRH